MAPKYFNLIVYPCVMVYLKKIRWSVSCRTIGKLVNNDNPSGYNDNF
jgi:hypothetical protein